ncbi:MAG: hypothetical protein HZA50_11550 [Planctomycetes bacterium]|nr:hypothetical protein [Planctomycetota bacterium]
MSEFENVNSKPTLPPIDLTQVRFSELAAQVEQARRQGYTEADIRVQLLNLAQLVIGIAGKFI